MRTNTGKPDVKAEQVQHSGPNATSQSGQAYQRDPDAADELKHLR
jgi:hypothetical protein